VELKREYLQSQVKDLLGDVAFSPLGETDFGSGDKARTLIHSWTDLNINSCSEWRKRIKIHFLKSDFVRLISETSRIRNFQYPCIITTMKDEMPQNALVLYCSVGLSFVSLGISSL
jgi:hypothetical protein